MSRPDKRRSDRKYILFLSCVCLINGDLSEAISLRLAAPYLIIGFLYPEARHKLPSIEQ